MQANVVKGMRDFKQIVNPNRFSAAALLYVHEITGPVVCSFAGNRYFIELGKIKIVRVTHDDDLCKYI